MLLKGNMIWNGCDKWVYILKLLAPLTLNFHSLSFLGRLQHIALFKLEKCYCISFSLNLFFFPSCLHPLPDPQLCNWKSLGPVSSEIAVFWFNRVPDNQHCSSRVFTSGSFLLSSCDVLLFWYSSVFFCTLYCWWVEYNDIQVLKKCFVINRGPINGSDRCPTSIEQKLDRFWVNVRSKM